MNTRKSSSPFLIWELLCPLVRIPWSLTSTGIPCFLKIWITPLHSQERPTSVLVFSANWKKKLTEDLCFYEQRQKVKMGFGVCFAASAGITEVWAPGAVTVVLRFLYVGVISGVVSYFVGYFFWVWEHSQNGSNWFFTLRFYERFHRNAQLLDSEGSLYLSRGGWALGERYTALGKRKACIGKESWCWSSQSGCPAVTQRPLSGKAGYLARSFGTVGSGHSSVTFPQS